jgi:hypothetical protein
MCFSADMSLGMGIAGFVAAGVTYRDKEERYWVKTARAYAIFHFSLMELIQYFAYPVADQCGYGTNQLLSQLSSYHIGLQAFAIMPALATYSSDRTALSRAFWLSAAMSGSFLLCEHLPNDWQLFPMESGFWQQFGLEPNFIGRMVSCLLMGKYHIAYNISSAFGTWVTHGSLFALALSGYLWRDNWKIASYHFGMAIATLFLPQWALGVSTGEAAAIYCFYSIPITASFMPQFKRFFTVTPPDRQLDQPLNSESPA